MNWELLLYTFGSGLCVGVIFGQVLEAGRWRANADKIMRIESRGRLFKVIHDEEYKL